MRTDGAFAVPSWIGGMAESERARMLVRWAMGEEGVSAEPNAGAHELAAWIVTHTAGEQVACSQPGGILFMGDRVTRWLAGTVVPGPSEQVEIEEATGGAVRWDSWFAAWSGEAAAVLRPDEVGYDREYPVIAVPSRGFRPGERAPLGETAPGPLWAAKRRGRLITVSSGFGLRFDVTEAAGAALRDSLIHVLPPGREPPGASAQL